MTTSPDIATPAKPHPRRGMEKFNAWFAFGLCTIAGLALLYFSATYYWYAARLAKAGQETTAEIVDEMQPRNTKKLHPTNQVNLKFTTDTGQQVEVKMNIPQEVYNRVFTDARQAPQTVRIRYLPSNPHEVDIVGQDRERRDFIIFSAITSVLLIAYGIVGLRKSYRHSTYKAPHSNDIADW